MRKFLQSLVQNGRTRALLDRVDSLEKQAFDVIEDVKTDRENIQRTIEMLRLLAHNIAAMVWLKDKEHLYEFANEEHCQFFFGLPGGCSSFVQGKGDIDLINYYRESTGKKHTFGDLCVDSDIHCKEQGKQCTYLEAGIIGDQKVVLKVTKTPIFSEGNFVGTVGVATKITTGCNETLAEVTDGLSKGTVVRLSKYTYWLKKDEVCLSDSKYADFFEDIA